MGKYPQWDHFSHSGLIGPLCTASGNALKLVPEPSETAWKAGLFWGHTSNSRPSSVSANWRWRSVKQTPGALPSFLFLPVPVLSLAVSLFPILLPLISSICRDKMKQNIVMNFWNCREKYLDYPNNWAMSRLPGLQLWDNCSSSSLVDKCDPATLEESPRSFQGVREVKAIFMITLRCYLSFFTLILLRVYSGIFQGLHDEWNLSRLNAVWYENPTVFY